MFAIETITECANKREVELDATQTHTHKEKRIGHVDEKQASAPQPTKADGKHSHHKPIHASHVDKRLKIPLPGLAKQQFADSVEASPVVESSNTPEVMALKVL